MIICERCKKKLLVGDEVHVIGNQKFCSDTCAICELTDELVMNAKDMATEQYHEEVAILTVRPTTDTATCGTCRKDLAKCETIFAADGILFCSRDCGIQTLYRDHFDDVAEEITPDDIGIKPIVTMTRDAIMEALKQLSRSQGRYSRLYNNMMDDSEYRDLMLGELEAQGFTDVIDLVLYFES